MVRTARLCGDIYGKGGLFSFGFVLLWWAPLWM